MNTSVNNYDSVEKLLSEEGLRIKAIDLHPELDVMLVILNTKAILRQSISAYPRLVTKNKAALLQYEFNGNETSI